LKKADALQIADDDGRRVLRAHGVIQSVSPEDAAAWGSYWAAMVPPFAPRRVLVLGLGGATLPHLIVMRWGSGATFVGVDDDPELLALVRGAGWLDVPGLESVCADAFAFVRTCDERFDYVAVDLYRGGLAPDGVLTRAFLARLAGLLDPPGWVCLNLYGPGASVRGKRAVRALFQVEHEIHVGENLVLHLRSRTSRRAPRDGSPGADGV
jgi:spermidine synthase